MDSGLILEKEFRNRIYVTGLDLMWVPRDDPDEHSATIKRLIEVAEANPRMFTPPFDRMWVESPPVAVGASGFEVTHGCLVTDGTFLPAILRRSSAERFDMVSCGFVSGPLLDQRWVEADRANSPHQAAGSHWGDEQWSHGKTDVPGVMVDYATVEGTRRVSLSEKSMDQAFHSARATIALMNVKGIELEDERLPRAERRRRERDPRWQGVAYKVLTVPDSSSGSSTSSGREVMTRRHLVRGHFATYTDSMFGRPLDEPVTVWKPAHVRGSADVGVVEKSYAVAPAD